MAQETFAFSSSALRSLRLQRELLEREDRRRALARESATHRFQPEPPRPPRRPQYCRDPTVHNALYTGDLLRIKSIFKDETTTNLVMETVSEELVWEPEQGLWVLSPRRQQTSALRIAAGRGYSDCARHLLLRGAEVDAVVGGRAPLHDCAAAPRPDCARLLLAFGADPNVLSAEGAAPLHLCTAPDSLAYAPPRGAPLICMYSHAPAPRPRSRQLCTGLSKGLSARQVRGAAAGARGAGEPGHAGPAGDGAARGGAAGAGGARGAVPATRRRPRAPQPPGRDPPERGLCRGRAPRGRRALLPGGRAAAGGRGRPRGRGAQRPHAAAQRLRQRAAPAGAAAAAARRRRHRPQLRRVHAPGLRPARRRRVPAPAPRGDHRAPARPRRRPRAPQDAEVLLPAPAGAGGCAQRLRPHPPRRELGGGCAPGAVGGAPGVLHLGRAHGGAAAAPAAPGPLRRAAAPGRPLPPGCSQAVPAAPPAPLPAAAAAGDPVLSPARLPAPAGNKRCDSGGSWAAPSPGPAGLR